MFNLTTLKRHGGLWIRPIESNVIGAGILLTLMYLTIDKQVLFFFGSLYDGIPMGKFTIWSHEHLEAWKKTPAGIAASLSTIAFVSFFYGGVQRIIYTIHNSSYKSAHGNLPVSFYWFVSALTLYFAHFTRFGNIAFFTIGGIFVIAALVPVINQYRDTFFGK